MLGVVDVFGAPTGAQTPDPSAAAISLDTNEAPVRGTSGSPVVSGDGSIVVFSNSSPDAVHSLMIRDSVAGITTVFDTGDSRVEAGISGDGCVVAYSVQAVAEAAAGGTDGGETDAGATDAAETDAGATDAGTTDAGATDAGTTDTGTTDGDGSAGGEGVVDAGADGSGGSATGGSEAIPVEGDSTTGGSGINGPAAPAAPGSNGELGDTGGGINGAASALQAVDPMIELRTIDRCVPEGILAESQVLDTVPGAAALAAPALSSDGQIIAWAHGQQIIRYVDGIAAGPIPVLVEGDIVGRRLAMSADGALVVFEAGPPPADPATLPAVPTPSNVYALDAAAPEPAVELVSAAIATGGVAPDGSSSWPTMSADGSLLIFQSNSPTLLDDSPDSGDYLVLVDRSADVVTPRVLTANARRPAITDDGLAVAYDAAGAVRVRRSDTAEPFLDSTEKIASSSVTNLDESTGESTSGPVISSDGSVVVFDAPAGADLSTDVSLLTDGHVWARIVEPLFAPPPTTTTTSVATTTTTTTIPAATTTTTTTRPRTTPRVTTRVTTRATTPATTRPTTTTVPLASVFEPASFDFAPTIIVDGRRTADLSVFNPSTVTGSVTEVRLDPASDTGFSIDTNGCVGSLPGGSRCVVSVSFAPTETGEATANLIADFADGSQAVSALRGVGAPPPTMSILPGVASNGQVVTITGAGFPAGGTVQLSWHEGRVTSTITVDDRGGFAQPVVVLPNTVGGPVNAKIFGQVDSFGDVVTMMLVSDSNDRSNAATLGGISVAVTR